MSFRQRLLLIMMISGVIELLVLSLSGFMYIKFSQEEDMGKRALGIAQFLSHSPVITEAIETGDATSTGKRIAELTHLLGATFIVVGDKEGIRIIHPVAERIGLPMKGGDNDRALLDGEAYISYATGSLGKSVRGKSAVFDRDGNIIGVVSVGYLLDSLQDKIEPYLLFLLSMALLVVTANAVLSNYAAKRFQKALLGFEPEEIGRLYSELDVTLSTIQEGVISIDLNGVVQTYNSSAERILELDKSKVLGKKMADVMPTSFLDKLLETKRAEHNVDVYINGVHVLANRNPIYLNNEIVGVVSSFRRRDEITELTEQLFQAQQYSDLLRSQTHEHRNKLNTISGMLQLGETQKVIELIGSETDRYQNLISYLREFIQNPLIAGLLLGKVERARELGLILEIEEGSRLDSIPRHINPEDVVTIVGNLIDNAFEATLDKGSPDFSGTQKIVVSISDYGNDIVIEVEDNGIGLPDNVEVANLLKRGHSTKADKHRGVGLHLVTQLTKQYGGQFELLDKESSGVRASIFLPKQSSY